MRGEDGRAALAVSAAIVGAGFASGREVAVFFSAFGQASWLGVAAASAGVGYLTCLLARVSRRTGCGGFAAQYGALAGPGWGAAVRALYGLLALLTAGAMAAAGGELGALALPWRRARAVGVAVTLLSACLLARRGVRSLASLGALLVPTAGIFYALLSRGGGAAQPFTLPDALLSLPMGLLYAAFNAALAAGVICLSGRTVCSPGRVGRYTAAALFAMLAPANYALMHAGAPVRSLPMPGVALAARWGVGGYYASLFVLYLAVLSTLVAMLCALAEQLPARLAPSLRRPLAPLGALLFSACGVEAIGNVAYPLLGWICALALLALPLLSPARCAE